MWMTVLRPPPSAAVAVAAAGCGTWATGDRFGNPLWYLGSDKYIGGGCVLLVCVYQKVSYGSSLMAAAGQGVMTISWVKSIHGRAASGARVRVNDRHPPLVGKVGRVMKVGHEGNHCFYDVKFPASDGKKAFQAVVAAHYCNVVWEGDEDTPDKSEALASPGASQGTMRTFPRPKQV